MSINVHGIRNKVKHITVTGEITEEIHVLKFLEMLNDKGSVEVHVTFQDASILPSKIIDSIIGAQNYKRCYIYVAKHYLYTYMYKLGIQCRYIPKNFEEYPVNSLKAEDIELELRKEDIMTFLKKINAKYGYDYTEYQLDSIMRRIKISMIRENTNNFYKFQKKVFEDYSVFEQLFLDFSVNTTKFFRDPEVFASLKDKIFPQLNIYPYIRIWCAGCSTGEEPYSLAILLKEAGLLHKTQIYATDINPYAVEEAKNGLYPKADIEESIRNYRKATGKNSLMDYFELGEGYVKIDENLKKNILFFQHSLLSEGIINEFQLILCRNVLIYFNPSLQKRVLQYLSNSLDRNGFLVLEKGGGMLQSGGYNYFNKYDDLNKIYQKKEKSI